MATRKAAPCERTPTKRFSLRLHEPSDVRERRLPDNWCRACPCCGFLTLSEHPPGAFATCPVCWSEDDGQQYASSVIEIRCARQAQDGPILMFGLAEEPDGGGWSLIFTSDQADPSAYAASTMDGATAYGAVEAWTLDDNVLRLRLTSNAAVLLGVPPNLSLRLNAAYVNVADVRRALADIANPS